MANALRSAIVGNLPASLLGRLTTFVADETAESPQLARPFDFAVVGGTHGVAGVLPLVMAAMRLAVISFGSQAEVDEEPG